MPASTAGRASIVQTAEAASAQLPGTSLGVRKRATATLASAFMLETGRNRAALSTFVDAAAGPARLFFSGLRMDRSFALLPSFYRSASEQPRIVSRSQP